MAGGRIVLRSRAPMSARYVVGKKRYTRRNKPGLATRVRIYNPNPVPDKMKLKVRYATSQSKSTTTVISTHKFRGNSIHEPDATLSGHQPLGHDQWAAFYDKYFVSSCKIEIIHTCQTPDVPYIISCYPKNVVSTESNPDTIYEKGYVRKQIGNNATRGKLVLFTSTNKIVGTGKIAVTDNTYVADFGGSPAQQWYYHIHTQALDEATQVIVNYQVLLTYYATLFDRRSLTES